MIGFLPAPLLGRPLITWELLYEGTATSFPAGLHQGDIAFGLTTQYIAESGQLIPSAPPAPGNWTVLASATEGWNGLLDESDGGFRATVRVLCRTLTPANAGQSTGMGAADLVIFRHTGTPPTLLPPAQLATASTSSFNQSVGFGAALPPGLAIFSQAVARNATANPAVTFGGQPVYARIRAGTQTRARLHVEPQPVPVNRTVVSGNLGGAVRQHRAHVIRLP